MYRWLGYAGLTPFVVVMVSVLLNGLPLSLGTTWFMQYSAIILAFMAGTQWGHGVNHGFPTKLHLVSVMPPIIAYLLLAWSQMIVIPPVIQLSAFAVLFVILWSYDCRLFAKHPDYLTLRHRLTAVVLITHSVMAVQYLI